jgi:hypothetical protein
VAAELEDVSTSRTMRTSKPRIGATGVLAVLAVAVLLAGGFGLMGGRSLATPRPQSGVGAGGSASADAAPGSSQTPWPPTIPPVITDVTPWTECSTPSDEPPEVRLEVGPIATLGSLEILYMASGGPPPSVPAGATYPISIPAFTAADIWIVGARCAVGWSISLDGEEQDRYVNPGQDPRVASQNRFSLGGLSRFGGRDPVALVATLVFPAMTARVTWQVAVDPWPRPSVVLRGSGGSVAMSPGCDVEYFFPQADDPPEVCDTEVREAPTKSLVVHAGEEAVTVEAPGWTFEPDVNFGCGTLAGGFLEDSGSCLQAPTMKDSTFTFPAPEETGVKVVRISFCGRPSSSEESATVCVTWFGQIDVRPAR